MSLLPGAFRLPFLCPRLNASIRPSLRTPQPPTCTTIRCSSSAVLAAQKKKKEAAKRKGKKKRRVDYINQDLKRGIQFPLAEAMRYIRAIEVGRDPRAMKYDLAIRLRTVKTSLQVRGRVELPHTVSSSSRICVICPPNSPAAQKARKGGAVLVGEDEVFDAVKAGKIEFDRCLCHESSVQKMNSAGIARALGPKGLMPNAKQGTVVRDVAAAIKMISGTSQYRERYGVIRCAVGQLGFSPTQMQENVKEFVGRIKQECGRLSDINSKEIHEVVLSSTNSPGFSLNGDLQDPAGTTAQQLLPL